jgi:glycerophosphoryl diester phosphodiesterase
MRRTAEPPPALAAAALAALALGTALSAGAGPSAAQEPNPWLTERRMLNLAHGGGQHEAPDNTLYAFKTALDRGADALEMDLHITLDGHVVVIHDSTVDRTTNGTGCVVAHTLAELRELDFAYDWVPGEGPTPGLDPSAYPFRGVATGDVAPPSGFAAGDFGVATLEEVFQAQPDALMVMELKPTEVYQSHDCPAFVESLAPEDRPDLAAEVARLIDAYDMADQVLVASFIDDLLHHFMALAPGVDTSFPIGESIDVYVAYVAGLPLPNPRGHEAFQVPRTYSGIDIDAGVVAYARAHGVAVHYWTINDPAEMEELLGWCADGLITDEPSVLAAVLAPMDDPCVAPAQATTTTSPAGTSTTAGGQAPTARPGSVVLARTGSGDAGGALALLGTVLLVGGAAAVAVSSAQQARARRS